MKQRRNSDRFYRALERFPGSPGGGTVPDQVMNALCDDLNTPLALSAMHALADAALAGDAQAASNLRAAGELLGLVTQTPETWFHAGAEDTNAIETAIQERLAARKARDFARADAIRADLADRGIHPRGRTGRNHLASSQLKQRLLNAQTAVSCRDPVRRGRVP